MSTYSRTIQWGTWSFLGAVILWISVAYFRQRTEPLPLPFYNQLSDFALTNQNEQIVTLASLHGQAWIANVIFTRCSGPCFRLTRQMQQVQAAFPEATRLRFVSLTADPAYDTPAVLRSFGERFHAEEGRWFFLTGNKSDIYSLAANQLKLTVIDNEKDRKPDEDIFIHSQKFVLVDRDGRIRGYIDGDEPETVPRLIKAVQGLLKEKD